MKALSLVLSLSLLFPFGAEGAVPTASPPKKDAANPYIYNGLLAAESHKTQEAIRHLTGGIQANPADWRTYQYRAEQYLESREWAKAVQDCTAVMRLMPTRVRPYTVRAIAYYYLGRDTESLADINTVIKTRPNELLLAPVNELRKRIYAEPLRFSAEAVQKAAEQANRDVARARGDKARAQALNNRAWLFATSPLKELRNADQAVRDAEEACALTAGKDSSLIDTLAATYAEQGDYQKAVATEKQALSLAEPKSKLMDDESRHLAEYGRHQPHRMSAIDRQPRTSARR